MSVASVPRASRADDQDSLAVAPRSGRGRGATYRTQRRVGSGGRERWTALYRLKGQAERSAGTFDTEEEAERAAWRALLAAGELGPGELERRAQEKDLTTFKAFLGIYREQKVWEAGNSAQRSHYVVEAQLLPRFGHLPLRHLDREAVGGWVRDLLVERGLQRATVATYKGVLSEILARAVDWGYLQHNPALGRHGLPKKKPRRQKERSLTAPQVLQLSRAMPGPITRLIFDLMVHTGMRPGEVGALKVGSMDSYRDGTSNGFLAVMGSVANVGERFNPDRNGRVEKRDVTKTGIDRYVGVSEAMMQRLIAYGEDDLGADMEHDLHRLLFPRPVVEAELRAAEAARAGQLASRPDDLGRTEPNALGRTYAHGTTSAYTAGGCKCQWCRAAYAEYRRQRRAAGKDRPPVVAAGSADDLYLTADWWRTAVWVPTMKGLDLDRHLVPYDTRHTHATLLTRGGVPLDQVGERLGHQDRATTELYVDATPMEQARGVGDIMDAILAAAERETSPRRLPPRRRLI